MNRTFRALGFALSLLALVGVEIRPVAASGWELVFHDEFDGPSLDRTKWATRYIYEDETLDHFNDEKQRYRDNGNHVFSGYSLSLVARKGDGDLFESGMIRTHRTFYYGYFESRVRLPNARGVWPAFWLVGDYDGDGKTWHPPEIDIFEYVINGVEDKENMLHSQPLEKGQGGDDQYTYVHPSFTLGHKELYAQTSLSEGWHTAGLVWSPTEVSFFWDGRHIYSRRYKWLRPDGELGPPAQVVLNFAVGGSWAGRHGVDREAFPQVFEIDYVRVCQFTRSEAGSDSCGGSELTPSPTEFGYSASLDDMPKPTFRRLEDVPQAHPIEAGHVKISAKSQPLEVTIPFKAPDNYPKDRIMRVYLVAEQAGTALRNAEQRRPLWDILSDSQLGQLKVALPALKYPGKYRLEAEVLANSQNEEHKHESRPVPVACDTSVVQPPKARKCVLLSIEAVS